LSFAANGHRVVHLIDYRAPVGHGRSHHTCLRQHGVPAASSSQWLVGNADGTVLDGSSLGSTLRYFGFGQALSIAGSAQRVAVSTAIGKILFSMWRQAHWKGQSTHQFAGYPAHRSRYPQMAACWSPQYGGDGTVQVYSLPSGTLTYSWPPATSYLLACPNREPP